MSRIEHRDYLYKCGILMYIQLKLFCCVFVALKCDELGLASHIWLAVIYSELYTQILDTPLFLTYCFFFFF